MRALVLRPYLFNAQGPSATRGRRIYDTGDMAALRIATALPTSSKPT